MTGPTHIAFANACLLAGAAFLTDSLVLGSYFFGLDGFRFHILHLA